jgi:hypothetical protein
MRRHDSFDILHKHRFYFWNFGAGSGYVIMNRKPIALEYEIVCMQDDFNPSAKHFGLRICEFIIRMPHVTLSIDDDYIGALPCPDRFNPINAGVREPIHTAFVISKFVTLELYASVIQRAWRRWNLKKQAARVIWATWENVRLNPRTFIGRKRLLDDIADMDPRVRPCW